MHRQRFISNTVFLVLTSLVAQIVNLFVLPLFIENLGEEMYGIFILSGILLGYLNLLDFGFTQGLTRYIARAHAEKDEEKLNEYIAAGFWLLTAVGLVAAALIYFGRFAIVDFFNVTQANRTLAVNLLVVTAVLSIISWPSRLLPKIMDATLHIKQIRIWDSFQAVTTSLVMLLLVYHAIDIVSIKIATGSLAVASLLPKLLLVRRYVPQAKWQPLKFRFSRIREMSGFSLGMFYAGLLSVVALRMDHIIIGRMLSLSMIAPYVVAAKLFELCKRYTTAAITAMLPTVYNLQGEKDANRLQTLLNDGVRYRALLFTPMAYLGIVVSPAFIRTWMGPEYVQYAIWSRLFLVVFLLTPPGMAKNMAKGLGHLKLCNGVTTAGTLTNLTISIALIPRFGIGGPMLGTIVMYIVFGEYVFSPFYCKISGLAWRKLYFDALKITTANLPVMVAGIWIERMLAIDGWIPLIAFSAITGTTLGVVLFFVFVRDREKRDIFTACQCLGITRIPLFGTIIHKWLIPGSTTVP